MHTNSLSFLLLTQLFRMQRHPHLAQIKPVNTSSPFSSIFIVLHPPNTTTNCGEQTVVLLQGLTVFYIIQLTLIDSQEGNIQISSAQRPARL